MQTLKWIVLILANCATFYFLKELNFDPEESLEMSQILVFVVFFGINIPLLFKEFSNRFNHHTLFTKDLFKSPLFIFSIGAIFLAKYFLHNTFWPILGIFLMEFGIYIYILMRTQNSHSPILPEAMDLKEQLKSISGANLPIAGGDGTKLEKAIHITSHEPIAIAIEYTILDYIYRNRPIKFLKQTLVKVDSRYFDVIEIASETHTELCFFDVTSPYTGRVFTKFHSNNNQAPQIVLATFGYVTNQISLEQHKEPFTFMHESQHSFAISGRNFVLSGKADAQYLKNYKILQNWTGTQSERLKIMFGDNWKDCCKQFTLLGNLAYQNISN